MLRQQPSEDISCSTTVTAGNSHINGNQPSNVNSPIPQNKKRRAKVACDPCRQRKKKCNGRTPCDACIKYEYDCHYSPQSSDKKVLIASTFAAADNDLRSIEKRPVGNNRHGVNIHKDDREEIIASPSVDETEVHLQSMEANSSVAFVRKLQLMNDSRDLPRVQLFAWNVGDRLGRFIPQSPLPVVDIVSQSELWSLARVFFDKVYPTYGFVDRDTFFERLGARWAASFADDPYDSVLAGVAAMGLLFSQKEATVTEFHLVESARSVLERYSKIMTPPGEVVTGWVLRVAYLRMTATPHEAWMASCTMMQVLEAAGFHLEPAPPTVPVLPKDGSSDIRRRVFGIARHLNIWISYDLGRSRAAISKVPAVSVLPQSGDYTFQLLSLLPPSQRLDPEKIRDKKDLENDLMLVLENNYDKPPVIMAQCNVMLCIYRRLRVYNSNISNALQEKILALAEKALHAAQNMVEALTPWHHVSNIPFQVICLLLSMDTRASLSLLGKAMQTLSQVMMTWDSTGMREAYSAAKVLAFLCEKRKEEDARIIREALKVNTSLQANAGGNGIGAETGWDSPRTSWLDGVVADIPDLHNFDLEQFLMDDALGQMNGRILESGPVGEFSQISPLLQNL